MKKTFIALVTGFVFTTTAFAQTDTQTSIPAHTPKWVPQSGYWVVETNVHNAKSSIIYFYNNSNEMVYKENVEGVEIKIKKRRVKMNLQKVLGQSLVAYEAKHKAAENEMLVVNLIKKH